jgi:FtsZ-interacting cell division protein ZipA
MSKGKARRNAGFFFARKQAANKKPARGRFFITARNQLSLQRKPQPEQKLPERKRPERKRPERKQPEQKQQPERTHQQQELRLSYRKRSEPQPAGQQRGATVSFFLYL